MRATRLECAGACAGRGGARRATLPPIGSANSTGRVLARSTSKDVSTLTGKATVMIVVGVILLLLALVVIIYMWLATAGMPPVEISYGVLNVGLTPVWLFFLGGIALAVATSGLWLLGVGAKSAARRNKEMRELRRQAKDADRRAERHDDAARLDRPGGGTADRASATTGRRTTGGGAGTGTAGGAGSTGTRPSASDTTSEQDRILRRPGHDDTSGA